MEPIKPNKQSKLKNVNAPPDKPTPPVDTAALQERLTSARKGVEEAFKAFHQLLLNKKLDRNKSEPDKDQERKVADALFKAVQELDRVNPGEGTVILGSIGIREVLKMRDRMNDVEYLATVTHKELNELKQQLGVEAEHDA